jgi:hypothetical protein
VEVAVVVVVLVAQTTVVLVAPELSLLKCQILFPQHSLAA